MHSLAQDIRQAWKSLGQRPGFTAVVVAMLGVGIGVNVSIFTLIDQLLLRALPVRAPERLVVLDTPGANRGSMHRYSGFSTPMSYPMYRDLRDSVSAFDGVLARLPIDVDLTRGEQTERVNGELVSGNYFDVLGVVAARGRVLTASDDVTRLGQPVAVLSHGFWAGRLGADPDVVGRELLINGHALTVVGVAAAGFQGLEVGRVTDVFVPLTMKPWMTPTWDALDERRTMWLNAVARLKDGVSVQEAQAAAGVVYARVLAAEIEELSGVSASFRERFLAKRLGLLPAVRGRSDLRTEFGAPLQALMGMVALVLLIACANVANLLTTRAAARRRELAVRVALGASRARLTQQLLLESLALALLGGLVGVLLAGWATDALLVTLDADVQALGLRATPDGRVLSFALVSTLLAALAFGAWPALQASRGALAVALHDAGATVAGARGAARLRRALVVGEVALSLLLLCAAGLFARSLANLRALDPGFTERSATTFSLQPALAGYSEQQTNALVERVRRELAQQPGVERVAAADVAVLTGSNSASTVVVDGYQPSEGENMTVSFNFVTADYFATLGVPLLRGRALREQDGAGAPRVAVVNETFARRFYGSGDALGRRFGVARTDGARAIEIVGLARDAKYAGLRDEVPPTAYLSRAQQNDDTGDVTFYVRGAAAPAALAEVVRATLRRVDARLPVTGLETLATVIDQSLVVERTTARLSAAFGLLATLLAASGLYAVLAFGVARRTREIGLRMALGAERRDVLRLVLGELLRLALTLGVARLVEGQLFGLRATDAATLVGATALLLLVVLAAGALPARRAARVDPLAALRVE